MLFHVLMLSVEHQLKWVAPHLVSTANSCQRDNMLDNTTSTTSSESTGIESRFEAVAKRL